MPSVSVDDADMFSTNFTPVSGRSAWRQAAGSLLVALVLASCGTSTGSSAVSVLTTGSTDSTVSAGPPEGDLPDPTDFAPPADAEVAEQRLVAVSRTVLDDLLDATGASSLAPDAARRMIELDGALQVAATTFAEGELDALPPSDTRAGFSRSTLVRVGPTEAATLGLGLLYPSMGIALKKAEGRPAPSDEPAPGPDESHITIDGGAVDLRIVQSKSSTDENGITMTATYDLAAALTACPDESGSVVGQLSADATIVTSKGATSSTANYRMSIDLTAMVDEMAHMSGYDMQVAGSAGQTVQSTTDDGTAMEGFYIEGGHSASLTGAALRDLRVTAVSGPGIIRSSSAVTGDQQQAFIEHQHQLAILVTSLVLNDAEEFWRSGACIDVTIQPSGDPKDLGGFETIDLAIAATSSQDQAPIVGTVLPTVSAGTGTVAPIDPTDLPSTIAYTAPSDASPSTVDVEVRSRRGIGRASLAFTGPQSLLVDGKLEVLSAYGTKCGGADGEWTLDLTADFQGASFTGTLSFNLDPSTLSGAYHLVGTTTGSGVVIPQQGSGDVSFVLAADGSAALVFTGTAYAGGGFGEYSVEVFSSTEAC